MFIKAVLIMILSCFKMSLTNTSAHEEVLLYEFEYDYLYAQLSSKISSCLPLSFLYIVSCTVSVDFYMIWFSFLY